MSFNRTSLVNIHLYHSVAHTSKDIHTMAKRLSIYQQ